MQRSKQQSNILQQTTNLVGSAEHAMTIQWKQQHIMQQRNLPSAIHIQISLGGKPSIMSSKKQKKAQSMVSHQKRD